MPNLQCSLFVRENFLNNELAGGLYCLYSSYSLPGQTPSLPYVEAASIDQLVAEISSQLLQMPEYTVQSLTNLAAGATSRAENGQFIKHRPMSKEELSCFWNAFRGSSAHSSDAISPSGMKGK